MFGKFVKTAEAAVQKKRDEIRDANEAKATGKVWNDETKEWHFYILDDEFEALAAEQKAADGTAGASTAVGSNADGGGVLEERKVADREYYDLMGVSTNASPSVIKKAYYKEARKCHPDKNPDDPEAQMKFQKLGTAYQILSDEHKKAAYDRDGKPDTSGNDVDAMANVDPSVFFNVMFGSSLVEPYIGELWLASQTDTMMKADKPKDVDTENMTEEERDKLLRETMDAMKQKNKLKQKMRCAKCARFLRDRIKTFSKENPDAFVESCLEEATLIVNGSYGDLYCTTIGFALQVAAEEYLGFETSFLGLGGHVARTKQNANGFTSGWKLLGAGIKAANAGSKAMVVADSMQKSSESGEGDSEVGEREAEAMGAAMEESLPAFLELAWAVNKRDIHSTLRVVCKKVFDDASVSKPERFKRAEAICILGKVFRKVGKQARKENLHSKDKVSADDVKARVAVATRTTMAKAQGQEISEDDTAEMIKQAKMEMEAQKASAAGGFAYFEAESNEEGQKAADSNNNDTNQEGQKDAAVTTTTLSFDCNTGPQSTACLLVSS